MLFEIISICLIVIIAITAFAFFNRKTSKVRKPDPAPYPIIRYGNYVRIVEPSAKFDSPNYCRNCDGEGYTSSIDNILKICRVCYGDRIRDKY